jgi:hypothetical protein
MSINSNSMNQDQNRQQKIAADLPEFDLGTVFWGAVGSILATIVTTVTGIPDSVIKAFQAGEPFKSMSRSAGELATRKMSRINQLTRGTEIIEINIDSNPAKKEQNLKRIEDNRKELSKLYGEVAGIIEGDLSNIRRINPGIVGTTKEIMEGFREVSKKIVNRSFPLDPKNPESHTRLNSSSFLASQGQDAVIQQGDDSRAIAITEQRTNNDRIVSGMKAMGLNPDNNVHLAAFSCLIINEQGGNPGEFIQQLPSFQSLEENQQKEFVEDVAKVMQTTMGLEKTQDSLQM